MPRQFARLLADHRWERPSLIPVLARDYLTCGPRRFIETLAYGLADRIELKLAAVTVSAVVVRGEHDPIAPHQWGKEVADGLPDGRLVEVPGTGHAVNWSAPNELAQIVRSLWP